MSLAFNNGVLGTVVFSLLLAALPAPVERAHGQVVGNSEQSGATGPRTQLPAQAHFSTDPRLLRRAYAAIDPARPAGNWAGRLHEDFAVRAARVLPLLPARPIVMVEAGGGNGTAALLFDRLLPRGSLIHFIDLSDRFVARMRKLVRTGALRNRLLPEAADANAALARLPPASVDLIHTFY
jgi:hypothetical protein